MPNQSLQRTLSAPLSSKVVRQERDPKGGGAIYTQTHCFGYTNRKTTTNGGELL